MNYSEYNTLPSLFSCSTVPDVATASYFRLAPVSFQHVSIIFLVLPYFLIPQNVPVSYYIHYFPFLALEPTISTRVRGFFYWRTVFRNQDLCAGCPRPY